MHYRIGGMNDPQVRTPIAKGAAIGFLTAFIGVVCYETPIWPAAHIFDILDSPAMYLSRLPVLLGMAPLAAKRFVYSFHFVYWIVNGALVGWCWGKLRAKQPK
jgi:hypothetical protein